MTKEEFAGVLKKRGANKEQAMSAYTAFREKGGTFSDDPVEPSSRKPMMVKQDNELDDVEISGANQAYVSGRFPMVTPDDVAKANEVYTGVENIDTRQAYKSYLEAENAKGEVIDVASAFRKVGEYEGALRKIPAVNRLVKDAQIATRSAESGGLYGVTAMLDVFPSAYRGLKELAVDLGVPDYDIPVLDAIPDAIGKMHQDQKNRWSESEEWARENNKASYATMKTLRGATDTILFLKELQTVGFAYGGKAVKGAQAVGRGKMTWKALSSAVKVSAYSAMTEEGVTMADRAKIFGLSTMYMATPALSGQVNNPLYAKLADMALNTTISTFKQDGIKDIINNEEMEEFDKFLSIAEIVGYDAVFSSMTKSFKSLNNEPVLDFNIADDAVRRAMNPKLMTPSEVARAGVEVSGKGLIKIDRTEREVLDSITQTREALKTKIAETEKQSDLTTPEGRPVSVEWENQTDSVKSSEAKEAEKAKLDDLDAQSDAFSRENDPYYDLSVTFEGQRYDRIQGEWFNRATGDAQESRVILEGITDKAEKELSKKERKAEKARKLDVESQIEREISADPILEIVLENGGINGGLATEELSGMFNPKLSSDKKFIAKFSGKVESNGLPVDEMAQAISERTGNEMSPSDLVDYLNNFADRVTGLREGTEKTENEMYDDQAMQAGVVINEKVSAYDMPNVVLASEKAMLDVLERVKNKPVVIQERAIIDATQKIGVAMDAPRGTHEVSIIKNLERIGKGTDKVTEQSKKRFKDEGDAIKSHINKMIEDTKIPDSVMKDLPADVQKKLQATMKNIKNAKTDASRQKAIDKFMEKAPILEEVYYHRKAVKRLKKPESEAKKLLKSGRVNEEIGLQIQDIVTGLESGRITDKIDRDISKATSYEQIEVLGMAREMLEPFKGVSLKDMTPEGVNHVADTLTGLVYEMKRITNDIKKFGQERSAHQASKQRALIHGMKDDVKSEYEILEDAKEKARLVGFDFINTPRTIAESLDYYKDGQITDFITRLERSYEDVYAVYRTTDKIIKPHEKFVSKNNQYKKNKDKRTVSVLGDDGKPFDVQFGIADRLRFYLATKDPDTIDISYDVGWKRKVGKGEKTMFITPDKMNEILKPMSKEEIAYGDALVESYRVMGEYMDTTALKMYGYKMALPNYTGARARTGTMNDAKSGLITDDKPFNIEAGVSHGQAIVRQTIESSKFLKSRTGSQAPLKLYDPVVMFEEVRSFSSQFYGQAELLREINQFLYKARLYGDDSLQQQYENKGKGGSFRAFEQLIKHYNEGGTNQATDDPSRWVARMARNARNYGITSALGYNVKVAVGQLASLPTASAVMDAKYSGIMYKSFISGSHPSIKEMGELSPYLYMRYQSRTGVVLSDGIKTKKSERGFGWISKNDAKVVGSIWSAMEQKVRDNNPLDNERAIRKKTAIETIDVLMKTQPTFESVSRPALARSDSEIAKQITMFSSQRNKNTSLATTSISRLLSEYKETGTVSKNSWEKSKQVMKALIKANALYAGILTIFQVLGEEILDAKGTVKKEYDNYDIEDDIIDIIKMYSLNFVTAGASSAGTWIGLASGALQKYDINRTAFTAIFDDAKKAPRLVKDYDAMKEAYDNGYFSEYMEKNWVRIGDNVADSSNLIIQPLTGVSSKNLYKLLVETPNAILTNKERDAEYKDTH